MVLSDFYEEKWELRETAPVSLVTGDVESSLILTQIQGELETLSIV
jgi:hypothetical protein